MERLPVTSGNDVGSLAWGASADFFNPVIGKKIFYGSKQQHRERSSYMTCVGCMCLIWLNSCQCHFQVKQKHDFHKEKSSVLFFVILFYMNMSPHIGKTASDEVQSSFSLSWSSSLLFFFLTRVAYCLSDFLTRREMQIASWAERLADVASGWNLGGMWK